MYRKINLFSLTEIYRNLLLRFIRFLVIFFYNIFSIFFHCHFLNNFIIIFLFFSRFFLNFFYQNSQKFTVTFFTKKKNPFSTEEPILTKDVVCFFVFRKDKTNSHRNYPHFILHFPFSEHLNSIYRE